MQKGTSCCKLVDAFKLVVGSGSSRNILSGKVAKQILKSAINRNNKTNTNNTKRSGYLRTRKAT